MFSCVFPGNLIDIFDCLRKVKVYKNRLLSIVLISIESSNFQKYLSLQIPKNLRQTCFCQPSRMSHFGELPDVACQKLLKQFMKKPEITNIRQKSSCLVMLSSGSTEIWFQPELPGLYILHQEMFFFHFLNFLSNIY